MSRAPLILLLLLPMLTAAQDFRATITGHITDANKAAIPNAQVTMKNIGTNEGTTATTDSAGNFTNTYAYRVQQFNGNAGDRNFGSLTPRTAGDTEVAYPRHIQLALKFRW
jgi:Carboxypeptidase regulatory-like domain